MEKHFMFTTKIGKSPKSGKLIEICIILGLMLKFRINTLSFHLDDFVI